MNDSDLLTLLTDLESDLVERKSSIAEKDKICEAICAFANDLPNRRQPGVVFVGARDDGSPSGLPITDELLRELSDLRTNGNIHPFPSLTVEKRRLAGADMAVVVVHPSSAPPDRLDDLDLDFFRREYLARAVARDVLEQNRRTLDQQLASFRLTTLEPRPTV